jgi:hypothetical protein
MSRDYSAGGLMVKPIFNLPRQPFILCHQCPLPAWVSVGEWPLCQGHGIDAHAWAIAEAIATREVG